MDRRNFLAMTAATAIGGRAVAAPGTTADSILGTLRAITITAPDLAAIEAAYAQFLGYQTMWRGVVPAETARSWGAPAVAGRRMIVMAPASGDPPYFRFVEQALPVGYRPLTSFGWNAAELLVQDPDELALRLNGSPFSTIGPPLELPGFPGIKAMQVVGPAKEVLYFTHFAPVPGRPTPARQPQSFVDYCFVAVVGSADMTAALAFYQTTFGNRIGKPFEIVNPIISNANGLPPETRHRLATVSLDGGKVIEVDQFPPNAVLRAKPSGGLPPGIAIVSFDYGPLDRPELKMIGTAPPGIIPPCQGKATATLLGSAGELIELVQR